MSLGFDSAHPSTALAKQMVQIELADSTSVTSGEIVLHSLANMAIQGARQGFFAPEKNRKQDTVVVVGRVRGENKSLYRKSFEPPIDRPGDG